MGNTDIIEDKLGFKFVRKQIEDKCNCIDSKSLASQIAFNANFEKVKKMLGEVNEMLMSITSFTQKNSLPSVNIPDESIKEICEKLKIEGVSLNTHDFNNLYRALSASAEYFKFFKEDNIDTIAIHYPLLSGIAEPLENPTELLNEIDAVFDKDFTVRDSASARLKDIRLRYSSLQQSVSKVMRKVLNSAITRGDIDESTLPVLRDGRLLIPVGSMNKRNIKGIIHSESATGKTAFIEPAEIVEINNSLKELEAQEQEEINIILLSLTYRIKESYDAIRTNTNIIIYFDFILAKALYAHEIGATQPQLSHKPGLDWYHAVNPILSNTLTTHGRTVIPLDISLNKDNRILVISGPNAGGKSVTLKTVGLIQYMTQCGILPPLYSNSHVGIFERIFIDIGDNQSIENELSTYSSHIRNMKYLISKANGRTLFLIDEFGSGTEPLIGGAIAEAILLELNSKKSWGIITTHYQNLKNIADATRGLVNGSMLYDRNKMQPLYILSIGSAGSSFALEIAKKSGLPDNIIAKATELVGKDYVDADKLLLDINRDRKYWEQKRYDVKLKEKKLESLISAWEETTTDLKNRRRKIIEEAKESALAILKDANSNVEKTIREIREAEADKEKTRQLRGELDKFREKLLEEYNETIKFSSPSKVKKLVKPSDLKKEDIAAKQFREGDVVKLKNGAITGDIIKLQGDKAIVNFGNTKTTVPVNRLSLTEDRKAQKINIASSYVSEATASNSQRRKNFRQQIDVRGMRVDEALQAITYYIDDAMQFGVPEVKILHGTGTGVLRMAIREHLTSYKNKLNFQDEDVRFGGAGITVIKFK